MRAPLQRHKLQLVLQLLSHARRRQEGRGHHGDGGVLLAPALRHRAGAARYHQPTNWTNLSITRSLDFPVIDQLTWWYCGNPRWRPPGGAGMRVQATAPPRNHWLLFPSSIAKQADNKPGNGKRFIGKWFSVAEHRVVQSDNSFSGKTRKRLIWLCGTECKSLPSLNRSSLILSISFQPAVVHYTSKTKTRFYSYIGFNHQTSYLSQPMLSGHFSAVFIDSVVLNANVET